MTTSKASTNDRPQVQEEASASRPPPIEMSQSVKVLHGPMLEIFQEIFLKKEKIGYSL